jgi:transposase
MTPKPRRLFTEEQKAESVRIVNQSGKPVSQVAKEMGLTESTLRKWVKQARINHPSDPQGQLTSTERKELIALRRDLKRVQMERDFLKKAATFFAQESSDPMSIKCQPRGEKTSNSHFEEKLFKPQKHRYCNDI